jgi:hypothetical protein
MKEDWAEKGDRADDDVLRLPDTIKTLIDAAFVLLTSRERSERYPGYVCSVRKSEVAW